ncbi:class I SAM-dependent methyltransferase [Georgenia thermotolerans]|uniref:Methyltransferase domain-containing protein n=1 Tax=Georgenia thermotolerans TaxID=527326 RepID=A0A7J5UUZ7_9MICO|nr:methyltransferase domain-containing protein [Georgenia thermotolerans]KAE8766115.1 methyltransferase domain-containing protein [Georgenia thermotolerans]
MGSEHFDAVAADWDRDEQKVVRARQVARAVAAAVPLRPSTRLLEYGAGTGLVTQALGDQVGAATLADNSTGMRAVIQDKIAAGALPESARVWDLDLESQPAPDERFDLIVTSLVLHHVHALDRVLSRFAELLEPGGHLCIADLDREDGSFHGHDFDGHHGFDRDELSAQLTEAGLVDVSVRDCTEFDRDGVSYSVFLAVARRPV